MRNGNVFVNSERVRNWTLRAVDFFFAYSPGNFALVLDVTIDQDVCSRW